MTATADEQLAFAGPGALAELVRGGQVHPRELVELCIRRIEALNPNLNAFRVTMAEEALAAADEAAALNGPLAGVPFAVKDEMPLAGQSVTRGSRSYGPAEREDCEAVRRLKAAGAIAIGVTNVPELMIWPWTATAANGVTRNPWDLSRTPGGSSGGSAAAVASGMVPAATAADGGGSIRIPAACCGLVGMKPTRGRVSLQPLAQDWLGLTVYGALARSAADSALLLDVLHGPMPGDADAAPPFEGSYAEAAATPPGRLRIARSRKLPPGILAKLSDDQLGAWEQTSALFEELGHNVVERDPSYGLAGIEFVQTWMRGTYEALQHHDSQGPATLEKMTRQWVNAGHYLVPPWRKRQLLSKRPATTARIMSLWDEVDVVMTPALASTAIDAEGAYGRSAFAAFDRSARFSPWTAAFNFTGQPALSVPAGFSADGLPLAVQLVGRLGAEDTLYALAGQIEAARPWVDRRPALG